MNPETGTTLYFAAKELASRFFELPEKIETPEELDFVANETRKLVSRIVALERRVRSRNAARVRAQAQKR